MFSAYLVDDEKLVLDKLINKVPWLDNGFDIIGFNTSAQTALEEITAAEPDVVFCDLKMPKYDGLQLIEKLKENGVKSNFVLLTAYQDFDACRELFRLEGLDYFLKPLNEDNAADVLEKVSRKLTAKRQQIPTTSFVPSQSQDFDDLVEYVTANFNKKLSLNELGKHFAIHPNRICNLFTKHYQSTLIIFTTNLRMKEASRLTLETDTPFKEIAAHCGYPNYQHFCKVFKSYFGKPPSEYREQNG